MGRGSGRASFLVFFRKSGTAAVISAAAVMSDISDVIRWTMASIFLPNRSLGMLNFAAFFTVDNLPVVEYMLNRTPFPIIHCSFRLIWSLDTLF